MKILLIGKKIVLKSVMINFALISPLFILSFTSSIFILSFIRQIQNLLHQHDFFIIMTVETSVLSPLFSQHLA